MERKGWHGNWGLVSSPMIGRASATLIRIAPCVWSMNLCELGLGPPTISPVSPTYPGFLIIPPPCQSPSHLGESPRCKHTRSRAAVRMLSATPSLRRSALRVRRLGAPRPRALGSSRDKPRAPRASTGGSKVKPTEDFNKPLLREWVSENFSGVAATVSLALALGVSCAYASSLLVSASYALTSRRQSW